MYRDDDVMAELEARVAGMTLEDKAPKGDRAIKKATRRTEQGKKLQAAATATRNKNEAIVRANLKSKEENSDDDWESDYEEDAPVVKLEELLGNMKICDDDDDEASDGANSEEEEKKS